MTAVKIVLNRRAIQGLLTSDVMVGDVLSRAERVAAACGDGFVARSSTPKRRARAAVITATGKAIRRNAAENTIVKNLGAGR